MGFSSPTMKEMIMSAKLFLGGGDGFSHQQYLYFHYIQFLSVGLHSSKSNHVLINPPGGVWNRRKDYNSTGKSML